MNKYIMKKLIYSSVLILGLILASCAPDKAEEPSPNLDDRDKYVADWSVSENSAVAGTNAYTVKIIKSTTNSGEIILNNFSGLSVSARATVNGKSLTIPYQQIGTIGFTQGKGTLSSSNTSISMNYTTTISTSRDSCTAVYTK
jgi:PBP1b-binding outer membrane lipoprotein LpoB